MRQIIHSSLPQSVENYIQETGRAGRDGLPATCHLLIDKVRSKNRLVCLGLQHTAYHDSTPLYYSSFSSFHFSLFSISLDFPSTIFFCELSSFYFYLFSFPFSLFTTVFPLLAFLSTFILGRGDSSAISLLFIQSLPAAGNVLMCSS